MDIQKTNTAVVFIDPQNDVLSEKGANWAAVGASVIENRTVENMERIFKAAKENGYEVFISPHYFYPTDIGWKFNGPLRLTSSELTVLHVADRWNLTGFSNSGAEAGAFQALYRRWKDDRRQPAQSMGIANQ